MEMEKDIIAIGKKIIDSKKNIDGMETRIIVYKEEKSLHINILNYTKRWLYCLDTTEKKYTNIDNIINDIVLQKREDLNDVGFSIAY